LCFSNGFFDLFWMNYPRKVWKAKAIQIFEKLTDSEIHEAIDWCKRRAKKWMYEKTEERYIPHPATWLNQKRRQDEINIQPATIQGTWIVIINKT
jgi:hypothetical protein